jgi:hypothetical protein
MITLTNIPRGTLAPPRPGGTVLAAAIDVEWSKNYRVKGGSVPFCYSLAWLALPARPAVTSAADAQVWYASAYVEHGAETPALAAAAGDALTTAAAGADLIAGHQMCSDLAVLAAASPHRALADAVSAWRNRQTAPDAAPRWLDTRYDSGQLLSGSSRRLVDICAELQLDVTQPELRGTSMTALHRRWLDNADALAREKITILNLRHSLSTALIAARTAGMTGWQPGLSVNQMLAATITDPVSWLIAPGFTCLPGVGHAP